MENKFEVIGLMSGTSLDGLDIAYCSFKKENERWHYQILQAETLSYPDGLTGSLAASTALSGLELAILDHTLGKWIGEASNSFIERHSLTPLFIASHGHTVFHQPDKGLTLQIGNPYEIMIKARLPVIYDFRSLDVAFGGQGAPLVPIGDKLLFYKYDFCLNLGGISNISFDFDDKRIAFDICPVNIVLNYLAGLCGLPYDEDGCLARNGEFDEELFNQLNSLPYYSEPIPKSLGIEWIQQNIFPLLKKREDNVPLLLNTFCHHIAFQISSIILQHRELKNKTLLVTGGGAFNSYLIELLKERLKNDVAVRVPDSKIVSFKEALIFAFLGVLRWEGKPNILKSVTGAKFDISGGTIVDNPVFN